jgi:guanylate kinase
MNNIKRIILVGKAASGKTWLAEQLIDAGYKFPLTYTTRPPRSNEINGIHYHFVSDSRFHEMISMNLMYEFVEFNGWLYGRTKEDFYSGNLLIMTPAGIQQMNKQDRMESYIVYLDISEDVRRERLSERNDADSVDRRLEADAKDFKNFTDYDYAYRTPNFTMAGFQMLIDKIFNKN